MKDEIITIIEEILDVEDGGERYSHKILNIDIAATAIEKLSAKRTIEVLEGLDNSLKSNAMEYLKGKYEDSVVELLAVNSWNETATHQIIQSKINELKEKL